MMQDPTRRHGWRRWGWKSVFWALAVFLLLLTPLVEFYTDWLWFGETGYQPVFLRMFTARATVGLAVGAAAFALLFGNLALALRSLTRRQIVIATREGAMPLHIDPVRLRPLLGVGAGVVALLIALYASGEWLSWLFYRHAVPFGQADPILGRDVGFYVFELPFLELVQGLLLVTLLMASLGTVAMYVLSGAVAVGRGLVVSPPARRHLSWLAASLLLVLAFGAYLDIPGQLTRPSGIVHGVSYVDLAARLPALWVLVAASVIGAALAAAQAFSRSLWPVAAAGGLYALASVAGMGYAAVVQRFIVAPNEQVKETPFIVHNIAATRAAFALDTVEERELSGDTLLTRRDIDANAPTLKNVRLWDHQPLLDTFGQIQEIRTYYDFVSVHNDRYLLNGEQRQIMLSARELNSESLPNRTWINERLTFTHGYGVALGPVNQVTPEGLPVLFIKNLPPESAVDLQVTEPSIYYGQLSNDYVFVKTKAQEFHYPKGDDNVYTSYAGDGGVPVQGLFRKLLFSAKFRSWKILLSDDITAESRVMFYRRLTDRVNRIAPFLRYDGDPYLSISEGRLRWIQDAYTVSRQYPYATPARNGINYIRNSVKATVDAYHGTTTFYLIDPQDPVAATLGKIFPELFRPLEDMPADLRNRMRYPEDIFSLQAAMYATYHMSNPAVFYNKEDQWQIPAIDSGGKPVPMQPYYTIMKLPGEHAPEFIQMLPFTPARKDNLAAWLVARTDGERYGRLAVFQLPKQKVIFGPRQVVGRINQDEAISPQITLWNQQGSEVIQGTLLVIPIEESLIYVRPLYLKASGGRIPELKRVIVAHQNRIVMEDTLEAALDRLFPKATGEPSRSLRGGDAGVSVPTSQESAGPPVEDLGAAREHYRRALQAQRDGNWALYGEEIRLLGELLEPIARRK